MKAGILGFGNVAAATLESFLANRDLILAKARSPIDFVRVATRTPSRAQGRVPPGCMIDDDPHGLVDDLEVDVVIELTGNVPLGRELVLRALAQGKHVITANKALLARHGAEIMAAAARARRRLLFEGAVAVSIPIIKTLREAVAANHITSVVGILNGTSNYVLSQMSEHGKDFATALAQAQHKGYAEADPTLDINGEDAAHKITLLASLAFGVPIDFGLVKFKGITQIEREDMEFAKRLGYEIKLIARAERVGDGMVIGAEPTLVSNRSMLAKVGGSMNGILLQGDLLGSAFLYGSGAGGKQTSSAVLADLLELVNGSGGYNMGFRDDAPVTAQTCERQSLVEAFYVRLRLEDRAGALAKVSRVLANANISAHSLLQDASDGAVSDLIVVTHPVSDSTARNTAETQGRCRAGAFGRHLSRAGGRRSRVMILVVCGSARAEGQTSRALSLIEHRLMLHGHATRRLCVGQLDVPLYGRDNGVCNDLDAWRRAAQAASALIFGSPAYHGSFGAGLKNLLDHLDTTLVAGKPAALVAASGSPRGGMATLSGMRHVLRSLHVPGPSSSRWRYVRKTAILIAGSGRKACWRRPTRLSSACCGNWCRRPACAALRARVATLEP